jgi:large subunit ribosomal protein L6
MKQTIEKISLPEGLDLTAEKGTIKVKGARGEVKRTIDDPLITVKVEGNEVQIIGEGSTKRERRKTGTWKSHISNMLKGSQEGHVYTLKICSGHFPMNVSVTDNEFVVKNFLGEKVPRKLRIKQGATVKVEGDTITVESVYKEVAGQTAADLEQLCKIRGRDSRVFQDGIWIINKDGKVIR